MLRVILILFVITFTYSGPLISQTYLGFRPPIVNTSINSSFQIDIVINNVENLYGVAFDVVYDNQFLSFDTITEGTFLNENGEEQTVLMYYNHEEIGCLIVGLSRLNNDIPGVTTAIDTPLVNIEFSALSSGTSELTLNNVNLYRPDGSEIYDIIIDSAAINIGSTEIITDSENKFDIAVSAYPNPFNHCVNFKISTDLESSDYSISIYDVLGNLIDKSPVPSSGIFSWSPIKISNKEMASGVYFFSLSDSYKFRKSGKLIYLK